MTATRDQVAGTVRPCPWRSKMIRRRELVFAAAHGLGRKQLPALVKIILYYIAVGIVPFRDQVATYAVLEPRRNAVHYLLHPTTVPVVKVLARRSASQGGRDDSVFGVVSIALFGFGDKVSGGVIDEASAHYPIIHLAEIGELQRAVHRVHIVGGVRDVYPAVPITVVIEGLIPGAGPVIIHAVVVLHGVAKPVELIVLERLRILNRPADGIPDPGYVAVVVSGRDLRVLAVHIIRSSVNRVDREDGLQIVRPSESYLSGLQSIVIAY